MAKYLFGSFAISVCLTLSLVAATTREPSHPEPSRKISEPFVSYSPQPQHFPNEGLYKAYLVIQRFKSRISSDPKNITTTWSGHDICGRKTYLGFHCGRTPDLAKKLTIMAVDFNDFGLSAPMLEGFIDQFPDLVLFQASSNNKLTGPIPPSIMHMQDFLLEMHLLNNQLSGCLPNELGMLTKTAVIDAGMNQLTGPIPSSFSCLNSVEQLNLGGNRLYGQVPDALCKLAGPAGRLSNLTLSGNYFTSVGPACSALIKDGVLDVKYNCIPGVANQRAAAECASFLSQPKTCPAANARVVCPAADAKKNAAAAPEGTAARDYSSYVTYATLHE
ncbi:unnamed protein product [Triticum turgidum subsp. durum]|uniref:Uncharacterized protein n=1 Tax=Triticum turgidum subsp. durum TaxID=4567 RepID=A0A9R1BBH2_TRITD|nr:unnamed protein product [Triticum turgidum subsp. durum]